jgi:soluble lytic murein transglycosylase-like protein
MIATMPHRMTGYAVCRRALGCGVLLAGLLACEAAAEGAQTHTLATIAQRSFEAGEARNIAQRSLAEMPAEPAVRQGPPATVSFSATARRRGMRLDVARLERTERYRDLIEHHCRLNQVDVALVEAIIYTESGGDALAVSPAGASGLMQLMPGTARELGVTEPLNPEQSIAGGSRYLRNLLDRFGSTELALWAYNAGPGAVQRAVLPAETETYVPRVLAVRHALTARDVAAQETVR